MGRLAPSRRTEHEEQEMNWDAVAVMSVVMVVICVVIVVFLGFKVKALVKKDADAHKNQ
jgi:heme/copper-type cytochrome/quinol oxidase subunit 2